MKNLKHLENMIACSKTLFCFTLLFVCWPQPAILFAQDDVDWSALKTKVEKRAAELDLLIEKANAKQLCTDYVSVSQTILSIYQIAAQYDKDHAEENRKIFQSVRWHKKTDPEEADKLPWNELNACVDIADHAIEELTRQLDGSLQLSESPDFFTGKIRLGKSAWYRDGKPVFPYTMVWLNEDRKYTQALGNIGGVYHQISFLNEDAKVGKWPIEKLKSSTKEQMDRNAAPLVHLLGHAPASWMPKKHPEITEGARNFTKYDIDNPLVRDWIDKLCSQTLPAITAVTKDQPQVHLLANEPHFATKKGGWLAKNGVSELTIKGYREWLLAKYKTLAAINESHGTSAENLNDIQIELPIDSKLRGTAVWYDWCRYNMDRVNDWFTFLKQTVQRHDPKSSPVSIKLLGHILGSADRDGGMDIEYLTKLQEVPGADLRAVPQGAVFYGKNEDGRETATGWASRYSYLWVDQTMMLDFSKSLCPDRPFYDSEYHGFGTVGWRHYNLDRNYVRSTMWLLFSHGMGAIKPWLWGREDNGALSNKADHIGEMATQPIAVDAYGRVMKEINAHSEEVLASVPTRRDVLIFYCEEAAIQSEDYMPHIEEVYEALKLLNIRTGFITPADVGNLDAQLQTLVVTPTEFISDTSLKAIENFNSANGRIVMVDVAKSFKKNELGVKREGDSELSPFASIASKHVTEMADELRTTLANTIAEMPLKVAITDSQGKPAYGVLYSQTEDPKTGDITLVLNNVSKDNRTVTLRPAKATSGVMLDAISGQRATGQFEMAPMNVRLLKARLQ